MILNNKSLVGILVAQVTSIILYGLFTDYSQELSANQNGVSNTINQYYPFFQDVHVMIFIGFGFLMTFLHKYNFSSLGYTFLMGALAIQYSILINGFFHCLFNNHWSKIDLDIKSLITGDFAAGAFLISLGALLGKVSLEQLLLMLPLELIFYAVNESIGVIKYEAIDMGGSMFVHSFGAFFGLGVSYMITNHEKLNTTKENFLSTRNTDLFAMIGTIFLWMFWPSFNGALATGNSQHRVVLNTVLSLINSCVGAFVFSKMLRLKFDMVDIQNASLAGGVAVGSSADLVIGPHSSLIIGLIAGIVSVLGYKYISPFLESCKIHDTCGVNNLHGIPGIIGGLAGAVSASVADDQVYGDSINLIFPARSSRTAAEQGGYQLAALVTTLGISILGGVFTGFLMIFINDEPEYANDSSYWEIPQEENNVKENDNKENNNTTTQIHMDEIAPSEDQRATA